MPTPTPPEGDPPPHPEPSAPRVRKIGGSVLSDVDAVREVARVVAAEPHDGPLVLVVSALGDSTDRLLGDAAAVSSRTADRELDVLLSTGEDRARSLVALALRDAGRDAVSLDADRAGVETDDRAGAAAIREVHTAHLRAVLARGAVAVVAGFQGRATTGERTTLGRGGSDWTAIALAAALGSPRCELWGAVGGVYSADPRVVPDAHRLPELTHATLVALSAAGGRVVQPRAAAWAARHDVELCIRAFPDTEGGTRVSANADEPAGVVGLAARLQDEHAEVSLVGARVPDLDGIAREAVARLDAAGVAVRGSEAVDGRVTTRVDASESERAQRALHAAFLEGGTVATRRVP